MKNGTLVKLTMPEQGEENTTFSVTNYNEVTRRCYITPTNSNLPFPGEELVSVNNITEL